MGILSHLAPWLTRGFLLVATIIFVVFGSRYILDPVTGASHFGIPLPSPPAVSNARVDFGAFRVGCGIVTFLCLISTSRQFLGLWFVAITAAVVAAVRLLAIDLDGAAPETLSLLRSEVVFAVVAVVVLVVEAANRWQRERLGT